MVCSSEEMGLGPKGWLGGWQVANARSDLVKIDITAGCGWQTEQNRAKQSKTFDLTQSSSAHRVKNKS